MISNHYIPRLIVKRWKAKGSPLWYFDSMGSKFSEKLSVERLFSKRNLWSDDLERFLHSKTENFTGNSISDLLNKKGQPNAKDYRSLFLLILVQAARSGYMKGFSKGLENIAAYSENDLNFLIAAARQSWKLCGIHVPAQFRLFLPDTGIFSFPIQNKADFSWSFALPMSGTFCLCIIPKEINIQEMKRHMDFSHLVSWSVGSSANCRHVVIHPDLYHYKIDQGTLANELIRMRNFVDQQILNINRLNKLHLQMKDLAGSIF